MTLTPDKVWRRVGSLLVPSFAALAAIVSISPGVSTARGDDPIQRPACPADNGASPFRRVFARRYLPTISAMSATSSWRWTPRSTPRLGAAPTFPMRPATGRFSPSSEGHQGRGRADVLQRFGVAVEAGGTGGSGIALYHDALFAEENGRILRYPLGPGMALPIVQPTVRPAPDRRPPHAPIRDRLEGRAVRRSWLSDKFLSVPKSHT